MGLDMYLIKRKKSKKKNIDLWGFQDELIYWRKANQIHRYFCTYGEKIEDNVSYKITKEVLEELLKKCTKIIEIVRTEESKIKNWQTLNRETGNWEDILEDGLDIINKEEIAEILPTQDGFFFGSTEYNEYNLDDIKYTKEKLEQIIDTIDFENEDCYYLASWWYYGIM